MRRGIFGSSYLNAGMNCDSYPRVPACLMGRSLGSRRGRARARPTLPKGHAPRVPMAGKTVERCSDRRVVARRQRNPYTVRTAGGLVAVVIIAFLLVSILGAKGSHTTPRAEGAYPLPAAVVSELNNVAVSALC